MTDEFLSKLKLVAPGTPIRQGVDDILNAHGGALIVFAEDYKKYPLVFQVGFHLNEDFSPQRLYELAKMDGAIVLDDEGEKILAANTHLVPDPSIPSEETGTRHRSAERIARQFNKLVIAISRRRKTITVYYGSEKHVIGDVISLMNKVNQALNTYEKYRQSFDKLLLQLDMAELEGGVTLREVCEILERAALAMKVEEEARKYLIELGTEGRLSKLTLDEMSEGVEDTVNLLILDYYNGDPDECDPEVVKERLKNLSEKELLGLLNVARVLNYDVGSSQQLGDVTVESHGFRILRRDSKIPMNIVTNVVRTFGTLGRISQASVDQLKKVEGIGETRAAAIRRTIEMKKRQNAVQG